MAEVSGKKFAINLAKDLDFKEVFTFSFLKDQETIDFLKEHGQIMIVIRGPPATGKNYLSELILSKFPSAVRCCADSFFEKEKFNQRTKNTLKISHTLCEKQVRDACKRRVGCVVVENSHVKTWEMGPYLRAAVDYGYTIIMATTLRKVTADPAVLAKINTKGLTEEYLKKRLDTFQEKYPMYIGWFTSPSDATFLQHQAKTHLVSLLNDGKFCEVFDAYSEDAIYEYFTLKSPCFCISTYCNSLNSKKFYLSETVQNVYGKSFTLTVLGFAITKAHALAIVEATEDTLKVIFKSNAPDLDDIISGDALASLSISDGPAYRGRAAPKRISQGISEKHDSITFKELNASDGKTVELEDWNVEEAVNVKSAHVIVLGNRETQSFVITNPETFATKLLSGVMSDDGSIDTSEFSEFDDGTLYCRLANDSWLIKPPKKIKIKAVLSGLYLPE